MYFCVISSRHLFHNISYVSFKTRSWQDKPAQPSWHLQVPSWQSPRLLQFNGQAYQNYQRIRKIEAAVLVFCSVCMGRFLAAFHSVPVIYLSSSKVGNLNAKRRKNGDDLCLCFLLLQRALLLSKLLTFCSESFTNRISWWQKRILESRFMLEFVFQHSETALSVSHFSCLVTSLTACLTSYTCIYLEAIWVSVWSWYLVAEKLQGNSAFAAAGSNPGIQLNHVFKACIGSAMFGNSIRQVISDANWSTICPPRRSLQSTCNALAALAFSNCKMSTSENPERRPNHAQPVRHCPLPLQSLRHRMCSPWQNGKVRCIDYTALASTQNLTVLNL